MYVLLTFLPFILFIFLRFLSLSSVITPAVSFRALFLRPYLYDAMCRVLTILFRMYRYDLKQGMPILSYSRPALIITPLFFF